MEPKVQIGNAILTNAQVMALRVAVTTFHIQTKDDEFRKDLGEPLADAYHARLGEVLSIIIGASPDST